MGKSKLMRENRAKIAAEVIAMAGTSRSNWLMLPSQETCFEKSCGGSLNCGKDP